MFGLVLLLAGSFIFLCFLIFSASCFSFNDPQHTKEEDSFYGLKYFVHLLQPALNDYLKHTGVQSFEGCPGVIITGTSPRVIRRFSWLMSIIGYFCLLSYHI